MNLKYVFLFLLLAASFSFSALTCPPYFTDNFTVIVYDSHLRPIQDAEVKVYYQLDDLTGKGYVWTLPYITGPDGKTDVIKIKNIEPRASEVDCVMKVYANYSGKTVHKDVDYGIHSDIIDLQLDAYFVAVKVMDQFSRPIEGAEVWFNSVSRTTDKTGSAYAHATKGDLQILVQYADGKYAESFKITNDTYKIFGIQLYEFTLSAIDDKGNALPFNATIGTNEYSSNETGKIVVERLGTAKPDVIVKYKNVEKPIYVDLAMQKAYTVIFDSSPPNIGKVTTVSSSLTTKLLIPASDIGQYSSGIGQKGVTVKYRIGDSGSWQSAPVYLSSKDQFVAEIPNPKTESIIKFSIEVLDHDGNIRTMDGQFMYVPEQQKTTNQSQTTPETTKPQSNEGISLVLLIAGFIIVIVVIYVAYRRFFGSKE
jgi:hypothetical protein